MPIYASSYEVFFTNPFVTQCGAITSCALYENDCIEPYTKGNLVIDSTNGRVGKVTAKQNIDAGYTDTVCVKCENSASSSITYNWVVQQKANCKVSLSTKVVAAKVYNYDEAATTTAAVEFTDAYTNAYSIDCPFIGCTIFKSGCAAELDVGISNYISTVYDSGSLLVS